MGEVFANRYELLDPIAEGGMGSVWLVHDRKTDAVLAAKLLRHSDAGSLLRFMREQSTRIHHPHVVTTMSWAGEDDTVLFTMPLVRGGSVDTLVGDWGPLPEVWVTTILDQTLDALEAVHAAGVVHRDVKPANLLLEPTRQEMPHVRLTDFGIAAPLDQPRLTVATTAVGTQGYMAPEQQLGDSPDPRQDLYAVATVGLEMLIGHPPPFAVDEIPDSPLTQLLVRARSQDPDDRPGSASLMRKELATIAPAQWEPGEIEVLDHFTDHHPSASPARPTTVRERHAVPGSQDRTNTATRLVQPAPPATPATPEAPSTLTVLGLAALGVVLLLLSAWLLFG